MRILTVRQPWAWSIIYSGKTVENRTRNIAGDYRGPVAIHAAKRTIAEDDAGWEHPEYRRVLARETASVRHRLDARGAIIGVVDLVDVHKGYCDTDDYPICSEWAEFDRWHLELANARALDHPVPWRGALGLTPVPLELMRGWLVEHVDRCTCGVGGLSYGHEHPCGVEPLARLEAVR